MVAWSEALQEAGISLSVWKIHCRIGLSGGLFVSRVYEDPRDLLAHLDEVGVRRPL
ncbi:MAG: hypothetical protein WBP81_05570 [Solirubrobacteraceae bacterium]